MRQEVMEKIIMCLHTRGITDTDINQDLCIILSDYEITPRETTVAIRSEDKNKFYMQKFIVGKTVIGLTDRIIQCYKDTVWKVLETINKPADEISADNIRLYLAIRQRRDKISKTTAGNELRCLSSFYSY